MGLTYLRLKKNLTPMPIVTGEGIEITPVALPSQHTSAQNAYFYVPDECTGCATDIAEQMEAMARDLFLATGGGWIEAIPFEYEYIDFNGFHAVVPRAHLYQSLNTFLDDISVRALRNKQNPSWWLPITPDQALKGGRFEDYYCTEPEEDPERYVMIKLYRAKVFQELMWKEQSKVYEMIYENCSRKGVTLKELQQGTTHWSRGKRRKC